MTASTAGKGLQDMWKKLSALEKALMLGIALIGIGWTARTGLDAQTTLPARVEIVEQQILQLKQKQDSTEARVGRIDQKLERVVCYVRAIYEKSTPDCIGQ